jgi:hypothetical protein
MPQQHRPFANHPAATRYPHIIENAQILLGMAIGESTRTSYTSGVNSYIKFVDSIGISPAFPASIETLCLWMSSLAMAPNHLKLGTCKMYLTGVINQHIERGFNNPLDNAPPMLDRLFAGIKRLSAYNNSIRHTKKPKLPITTDMLRIISKQLDPNVRCDSLVMAMIWVATSAMLRISEFTSDHKNNDRLLSMNQLTFINENNKAIECININQQDKVKHAVLRLHQSKTDPFRQGMDILIAATETIQALLQYLAQTLQEKRDPRSPLFRFPDGNPVNRQWFMKQVSTLLSNAGYDSSSYSSHSFRKGGAVSLQQKGISDSIIRQMGRWKSDAFHLYLRHPTNDTILHAANQL